MQKDRKMNELITMCKFPVSLLLVGCLVFNIQIPLSQHSICAKQISVITIVNAMNTLFCGENG